MTDDLKNPVKATRLNAGKPQWSHLHYKSLVPMIRVLEKGAKKYSKKNWQLPMSLEEIQESAQRHLAAIMDGGVIDDEDGELHMAHLMCNCMFWIYHYNKQNEGAE